MTEAYKLVVHAPVDAVAFGEAGPRTAAQLLEDVESLRAALPESSEGSELLVICRDRYHFAVGLLAAWQAGHAVALPPNGQPQTVRSLARQPAVRQILHDVDGGEGLDLRQYLGCGTASRPIAPIAPQRKLATLYTSGSTGDHQACEKLASQLLGEALTHVASFGLGAGVRIVATVPGHHIYGLLYSVLAPLLGGAAFLRETPLHAETIASALSRHQAEVLVSVPAHLRGLESLAELRLPRRTFSSGAPLPEPTANMLSQRFGLRVTEVYGSSETGGVAYRQGPGESWRPFPDVRVLVGEGGQVLVDSPFAPSSPRPFPCGDRVEMLPDGAFRLLGRLDGVVKVGGKRVALAEIEQRCLCLKGVQDAGATAVDVEGARGQEIWLAVAGSGWTEGTLRSELLQWFEPVSLPRRIRIVPELPREESGKLLRRKLRALFEDRSQRGEPAVKVLDPAHEERRSEDGLQVAILEIPVREDLLYFRGHFDGLPVLPGVVTLHGLALRQARRLWPDLAGLRKVKKLKFKRIIHPRQVAQLRLARWPGSEQVDFELTCLGKSCASGSLVFEPSSVGTRVNCW